MNSKAYEEEAMAAEREAREIYEQMPGIVREFHNMMEEHRKLQENIRVSDKIQSEKFDSLA